jgi:hypothetical protein
MRLRDGRNSLLLQALMCNLGREARNNRHVTLESAFAIVQVFLACVVRYGSVLAVLTRCPRSSVTSCHLTL